MPGFDRLLPARKSVNEIISDGFTQPTGFTGWTAQFAASRYNSWATPQPPSSSAYVLAVTNASTSAATTVTVGLKNPDYPRAVRIVPSTSAFVSANSSVAVTVNGTNQFGETIADVISLGNSSGPIDGVLAFKTITSIVLPACSSPATPFTVGLSNIFGLDRKAASGGAAIAAVVNGVRETTFPVVGPGASSGVVSPAFSVPSPARATVKISTAATTSAGALVEVFFHAQDTVHI